MAGHNIGPLAGFGTTGASVAAAPFTGGLSLAAPFIFKGLAGLFGGKAKRQKEERERRDKLRREISEFLEGRRAETERRGVAGLEATQLDPLSQPKARFRGDVARDLAGFDVSRGAPFRTTSTALSPESQRSAEEFFFRNVGEVSPNVPLPGSVPGAERFRKQRSATLEAEKASNLQRLLSSLLGK